MFKEFYKSQRDNRLRQIDELFAMLSEDAEEEIKKEIPKKISDYYGKTVRLLQTGINGLIEDPTRKRVTVDTSDEFLVLDPKNAEDKAKIDAAKTDGNYTSIISFGNDKAKGSWIDNGDTVDIPPAFFNLVFDSAVRSKFSADDAKFFSEVSGRKKTGKSNFIEVTKEEAFTLLNILNKINTARKEGPRFGYLVLMDTETDHIYRIILDLTRETTKPSMLFNSAKLYAGGGEYKPNSRAQHPESLQLAGFFFDAEEMEQKIIRLVERSEDLDKDNPYANEDFQAIIEPFAEAFNAGDHRDYKTEFLKIYKNFTIQDWINQLTLAKSCTQFNKEVSKYDNPHILHDTISDYRKAEAEKLGRDIDVKQSVVDAIVSDVPASNLIELIKSPSTKLRANRDKGMVEVHKNGAIIATYYQLSLKVEENNKLGRAHRNLKKKYDFANKAQDLYDHEVHYEDLIMEGAIEKLSAAAKDGVKVLKAVGKDLFEKLLKVAGTLKNWKVKLINQIKDSYEKHFIADTMALFALSSLNEGSVEGEEFKHIIEKIAKSPNLKQVYTNANAKIEKALEKIANSKYGHFYKVRYNTPNMAAIKNGNVEITLAGMAFNYAYIQAFNRMLVTNPAAEQMETYVDELVELYVDSIFGSTELPVWKLFAKTDKVEKPYTYLGIRQENKEQRVTSILANRVEDKMPLVILDATSVKNGLHHMQMYVLSKIVNDNGTFNPMYVWYNISYDIAAYKKGIMKPFFMAKAEVPLTRIEEE